MGKKTRIPASKPAAPIEGSSPSSEADPGNAAAQELLQRWPPKASDFAVTKRHTVAGRVEVDGIDNDWCRIVGPTASFEAAIEWIGGEEALAGKLLAVGYRQTIESVRREGVYESPDGSEFIREFAVDSGAPDIEWEKDEDGEFEAGYTDFFTAPAMILPGRLSAHVSAADQPSFPLQRQIGDAKLVRVQGADDFSDALSVRVPGYDMLNLQTFGWSVPWYLEIDGSDEESGGWSRIDRDVPFRDPDGGEIAMRRAHESLVFASKEDVLASGMSAASLLVAYVEARDSGSESADIILEGLMASAPYLSVALTVKTAASTFGDDEIELRIIGNRTDVSSREDTGAGQMLLREVPLEDVLDIESLTPKSRLKLEGQDVGTLSSLTNTTWWAFPLDDLEAEMSGGEGEYRIEARLL